VVEDEENEEDVVEADVVEANEAVCVVVVNVTAFGDALKT
jgi:hypothetical protein